MIYLFDANAVSDLMAQRPQLARHSASRLAQGDTLAICTPVYYELLRGLFWRGATGKLTALNNRVLPLFAWLGISDDDWSQAARFWADARRRGRQLGDPNLLLAALTHRLGAILVSADSDFDALPITREDWRSL
jgi:predicted nucleic acid-binding protein